MKRGLSQLLAGLSAIVLVGAITRGGSRADSAASLGARNREGLKTLPYDDDGDGILASERPAYGGALRVEVGAPISLIESAFRSIDASEAELVSLTYETLVRIDGRGDVQPLLADTWERDATMRRWKFHLRAGVRFQDGTALTPQSAVAALINADEDWRVTPTSDGGVQIETPSAAPEFPATLAERKYVLVRRSKEAAGGTGLFKIESWEAGKRAVLTANPDYWGGRPFLDSVDVQLGRAARERMIDLQVGKADVVELPAEMARRASDEKIRVEVTPPVELLALIFPDGRAAGAGQAAGPNRAVGRSAEAEARLREAISRSIDRAAIVNLVLQKEGQPAGGLLPQWISGTEFLFSSAADPAAARALVKEIAPAARLVLGYDSGDALEQAVAERIAVNAREAGITVTSVAIPAAPLVAGSAARAEKPKYDGRLVRVNLVSPLPSPALTGLLAELSSVLGSADSGLPESADAAEIYAREKAALETWRVVPIAHLPRVYGLGPRVRNWSIAPGTAMNGLPLADVWLKREAQ
jgi:peptide/nickel transport system substrate-binding protein